MSQMTNNAVIKSTVVMRLSSQGKNVTPTRVEESSDDCKPQNVYE
jgi:hypothetical protein